MPQCRHKFTHTLFIDCASSIRTFARVQQRIVIIPARRAYTRTACCVPVISFRREAGVDPSRTFTHLSSLTFPEFTIFVTLGYKRCDSTPQIRIANRLDDLFKSSQKGDLYQWCWTWPKRQPFERSHRCAGESPVWIELENDFIMKENSRFSYPPYGLILVLPWSTIARVPLPCNLLGLPSWFIDRMEERPSPSCRLPIPPRTLAIGFTISSLASLASSLRFDPCLLHFAISPSSSVVALIRLRIPPASCPFPSRASTKHR